MVLRFIKIIIMQFFFKMKSEVTPFDNFFSVQTASLWQLARKKYTIYLYCELI